MSRRAWLPHLAAVLGYALVAVAFSWPLLPNIATHLTGDPGGDTGVYVWNQWVFQHGAFVEHRNPLTTEHIFSLTPRPVDLSQHNYTLFLNVLAMPLLGWLGTVATFNVVYLVMVVLTAWMTFVLARRVTEGAVAESWLAGLAFAWAPLLVARSTGHMSLVAAAPLAGVPVVPAPRRAIRAAARLGAGRTGRGLGRLLRRLLRRLLPADRRALRGLAAAAAGMAARLAPRGGPVDPRPLHPAGRRAGRRTGARPRRTSRFLRGAGQRPRAVHADVAADGAGRRARGDHAGPARVARHAAQSPRRRRGGRRRAHRRRRAVAGAVRRVECACWKAAGCRRRSTGAAVRAASTCSPSSSPTRRIRSWSGSPARRSSPRRRCSSSTPPRSAWWRWPSSWSACDSACAHRGW